MYQEDRVHIYWKQHGIQNHTIRNPCLNLLLDHHQQRESNQRGMVCIYLKRHVRFPHTNPRKRGKHIARGERRIWGQNGHFLRVQQRLLRPARAAFWLQFRGGRSRTPAAAPKPPAPNAPDPRYQVFVLLLLLFLLLHILPEQQNAT